MSATDFTVTGVAASPVGDVLAVVGVRETATPRRSRVVAYRLDSSGAPLGPEIIVDTAAYGDNDHLPMTHPDVGFDYDGDMYIVWDDATRGSAGVCVGAFDAGGYPPPRA